MLTTRTIADQNPKNGIRVQIVLDTDEFSRTLTELRKLSDKVVIKTRYNINNKHKTTIQKWHKQNKRWK